jgi:hypothetical protein
MAMTVNSSLQGLELGCITCMLRNWIVMSYWLTYGDQTL